MRISPVSQGIHTPPPTPPASPAALVGVTGPSPLEWTEICHLVFWLLKVFFPLGIPVSLKIPAMAGMGLMLTLCWQISSPHGLLDNGISGIQRQQFESLQGSCDPILA